MAQTGAREAKLAPKQFKAIAALLLVGNVKDAAESIGVGRRTLVRWMDDPTFRGALQNAETEVVRAATRRLIGGTEKAITVIEGILENSQVSDTVRLRAAGMILDCSAKWREQVTLEERLTALEEQLGGGR